MSAALHRIEALPGDGRYALTFRARTGGEQTVVAEVRDDAVSVAPASLPPDWSLESAAHEATVRAVAALHEARAVERVSDTLSDVDGGWDVGLGNVVLGRTGTPECVADGVMDDVGGGQWACGVCGARAIVG